MNKCAFNHAIASHSQLALRVFFSPAYQSQPKNISYLLINIRPTPLLEQEKSHTYSPSHRQRKNWPSSYTAPPTSPIQRRELLPTIREQGNADKKFRWCRRAFWAIIAGEQIVRGSQDHWSHCILPITLYSVQHLLCYNKTLFIIIDNFHLLLKYQIYRSELSNYIIVI